MKILAFLQNQWFPEPQKIQRIFDRYPDRRNDLIARFLFAGCRTGKRLISALGEELCGRIIWEESSPRLGSHASSKFPADFDHIEDAIKRFNPDVIVCFGKISGDAVREAVERFRSVHGMTFPVLYAPHPASWQNPMPALRSLAAKLSEQPLAGDLS